jgi:sugar lactone lactonase YvrE
LSPVQTGGSSGDREAEAEVTWPPGTKGNKMNLGHFTRTLLAPALATGLVVTGVVATTADASSERRPPPRVIALPDGFQPEGIAVRANSVYTGSLVDGDIYAANLSTGSGHRISQGDGTPATGMKFDGTGRLWVAGGADGDAKVINIHTGKRLGHYDFVGATTEPSFINDVVLRKNAAWFTDSQRAVLYRVAPLAGKPADARVRKFPLIGAWDQVPNEFNANGISTTADGRYLLVVQTVTGKLFRVNPQSGNTVRVQLGGYLLTNGDGMLRQGPLLYVAQNQDNKVAVLRLGPHGLHGTLVRTIRARTFDVPTTIATRGQSLYLPNARFSTPTATKYWITRVPR